MLWGASILWDPVQLGHFSQDSAAWQQCYCGQKLHKLAGDLLYRTAGWSYRSRFLSGQIPDYSCFLHSLPTCKHTSFTLQETIKQLPFCLRNCVIHAVIVLEATPNWFVFVVVVLVQHQGMAAMSISASLLKGGSSQSVVFFLGLYMMAIGAGGIKPCVSSFGFDQFDGTSPAERLKKHSFFNWFFFAVYIGSFVSGTAVCGCKITTGGQLASGSQLCSSRWPLQASCWAQVNTRCKSLRGVQS